MRLQYYHLSVTSYENFIYLSYETTFSGHYRASRVTNLNIQPSLQRYSVKRKKSSDGEHIIVFLEKYFLLTISIFSLLSRVQKLQQKDVQISIIKIV